MRNSSHGYFMKIYKGSRELYKYLWSISEGIPITGSEEEVLETRKLYHIFITHLYVSNCLESIKNEDNKEYITTPISSVLIWSKLNRKVATQYLRELDIIRYKPHSHSSYGKGRCREYRLNINIFRKAHSIDSNNVILEWESLLEGIRFTQKVNLFTGRPVTTSITHKMSTLYKNEQDFDIPDLIKESINSLQPCPFNPYEIIPWFKRAKKKFLVCKKVNNELKKELRIKHPDLKPEEIRKLLKCYPEYHEHNKAQGLHINMRLAMNTILNQNPTPIDTYADNGKQLWQYQAAYRPQHSGRVTEIHGGFQSINTPCKLLLLTGVPDIYNYDLKNSQAMILADELIECGLRCPWLDDYITGKINKEDLAKKVGISVACWKQSFYSIVMGAEEGVFGAVFKNIHSEIGDYKKSEIKHQLFLKVIKEMLDACENWRETILKGVTERYMYKHKYYYWKNACGMTYKGYAAKIEEGEIKIINTENDEELTNKNRLKTLKRELAAFFLQGREAYFIHNLTIACAKEGIPVYKNEHDGIITGKKIPEKLIKRTANKAGLPNLKLDIKEICSENKRNIFKKFLETKDTSAHTTNALKKKKN